jgi:hypothetical protein
MAVNPRVYREVANRLYALGHPASGDRRRVRGVMPLALSPSIVSTSSDAA